MKPELIPLWRVSHAHNTPSAPHVVFRFKETAPSRMLRFKKLGSMAVSTAQQAYHEPYGARVVLFFRLKVWESLHLGPTGYPNAFFLLLDETFTL